MRRAERVPRDQVLALGSLKPASNSSFSPDEEERAFTCRYLQLADSMLKDRTNWSMNSQIATALDKP